MQVPLFSNIPSNSGFSAIMFSVTGLRLFLRSVLTATTSSISLVGGSGVVLAEYVDGGCSPERRGSGWSMRSLLTVAAYLDLPAIHAECVDSDYFLGLR